jgi:hypothetical protein
MDPAESAVLVLRLQLFGLIFQSLALAKARMQMACYGNGVNVLSSRCYNDPASERDGTGRDRDARSPKRGA